MNKEYKVTILIPALNEEKLIADVVKDCLAGLKKANTSGQILIVDSGTDGTGAIAKSLGADVLKTPRQGLGKAYLDSIPYIKGRYVIMGDADGTYDYKEINSFISKLDEGYDFVMGTRLKGWIEKDSMPKLHRYFGTPLTTWILNRLFNTKFSDIQCGMRASTKNALVKIDLKSYSWEYAPEMVIKAGLLALKTTEIPIHFYKDKKGRVSHLKRGGWFTPWYAGWVSLKIMFLYAPNFVFFIPGVLLFVLGFSINLISILGLMPGFYYHLALLGLTMTIIGYLVIQLGVLSKIFGDLDKYEQDRLTRFMINKFNYNRGMLLGFSLFIVGFTLDTFLLFQWILNDFRLEKISIYGTFGLTIIILGFQTIFFTLLYEALNLSKKNYKV